jgi:hypothetical protein
LLGFGVVNIMRLNPDEVQVGDFVVELSNNGFYTRAQVWIRMRNGAGGWESIAELQRQYHFTSYLE